MHLDVKHLPKLRTADGELAQALPVRRHRPPLALGPPGGQGRRDRGQRPGLPRGGARGLPVPGHARADRPRQLLHRRGLRAGSAAKLGVEHRKTRPYTPRTNGMVERFNGRVQREVLGITVASHRDLERLLAGFNAAYNARRQRVLGGRSPEEVVRERLGAGREPRQPRLPATARSLRPAQGHAGRRARQGRLAARHLALQLRFCGVLTRWATMIRRSWVMRAGRSRRRWRSGRRRCGT